MFPTNDDYIVVFTVNGDMRTTILTAGSPSDAANELQALWDATGDNFDVVVMGVSTSCEGRRGNVVYTAQKPPPADYSVNGCAPVTVQL